MTKYIEITNENPLKKPLTLADIIMKYNEVTFMYYEEIRWFQDKLEELSLKMGGVTLEVINCISLQFNNPEKADLVGYDLESIANSKIVKKRDGWQLCFNKEPFLLPDSIVKANKEWISNC